MKRTLTLDEKNKKRDQDFKWVERMSWLMDNKFQIAGFRFGLDPLLSFIPFAGTVTSFATSFVLVMVMWRNGASSKLVVKMLLNISTDAILGAIPIVGNILDFFNKANMRNIKLMKEHYYENKHQGSAIWILLSMLAVIALIFCLTVYFLWIAAVWIWGIIF